jgi:Chaperone of endosialidase
MSSNNTTTTSQSATTNPYAPAIPLLANEASTIGNINTGVTSDQSNALGLLNSETGQIPDLTAPATSAVTNSLDASTAPWQGMLGSTVNNYMNNTNPVATNTDLNPYDTPGFSQAIQAMNTGIGQQVESQFAGSGRDPTGSGGGFAKAEALGEAQADAPVIQSQYNANVSNLLNANQGQANVGTTASSTGANEELSALQQQLSGLGGAGMLPGIVTAPGQTAVQTANTIYGQPWNNLSPALAASEGIAGMGGTSSGSGTTTQETSPISNILGLLTGGAGLAGAIAKSDERSKENIKKVGEKSGHNLYRFNYKSDPTDTPHTGVLAQEVEKVQPGAVRTHKGTKFVDYGKLGLLGMDRDIAA